MELLHLAVLISIAGPHLGTQGFLLGRSSAATYSLSWTRSSRVASQGDASSINDITIVIRIEIITITRLLDLAISSSTTSFDLTLCSHLDLSALSLKDFNSEKYLETHRL